MRNPKPSPVSGLKQVAKRRSRPTQGGRTTRKQAIEAFCKECIYDPAVDGTWLAQVRACTATACPIFTVRPGCRGVR